MTDPFDVIVDIAPHGPDVTVRVFPTHLEIGVLGKTRCVSIPGGSDVERILAEGPRGNASGIARVLEIIGRGDWPVTIAFSSVERWHLAHAAKMIGFDLGR